MDLSLEKYHSYTIKVKSEATARKYKHSAKMFIQFLNDQRVTDFSRLPRNTMQAFTAMLIDKGYSPSSITLYTVGAQQYLKWCRDQGADLPHLAKPSPPRSTLRVKEVLKREDILTFFQVCNEQLKEPIRTAVMLMPCSGLRATEMATLELDAIQKVDIRLQDGTSKTCLALRVIGKGRKERYVPLLDEGQQLLTQYITGWRRGKGGSWLFPKNKQSPKPLMYYSVWDGVRKVRHAMNAKITPHTLRRTYATTMWRRKVADTTIAKILGHENLQTLYKHYLNMSAEDLSEAVQNKGGKLLENRK